MCHGLHEVSVAWWGEQGGDRGNLKTQLGDPLPTRNGVEKNMGGEPCPLEVSKDTIALSEN